VRSPGPGEDFLPAVHRDEHQSTLRWAGFVLFDPPAAGDLAENPAFVGKCLFFQSPRGVGFHREIPEQRNSSLPSQPAQSKSSEYRRIR